ncbi:MAG: hypothetical protein KKA42_14475, partial [candidate division Zixibacteria bacterium]|nr:hypothetical protein [candidate division Zixibacteria bacterium]
QPFSMPDSLTFANLGTGLSGDIFGQYGRTSRLRVAEHDLHDIRTAFAPAAVRSKQQGADGILGNDLMRRFNTVYDYPHSRLFLKPNQTFGVPFD